MPLLAALIVAATGCADDPPLLLGVESARQVGTPFDDERMLQLEIVLENHTDMPISFNRQRFTL